MKRWILVGPWVALVISCTAPPVSPVQEWNGPVRPEPDIAMAKGLFDQFVDGTFSFDDEAFFWLCAQVRTNSARRELLAASSESPTPVRQMMERPADFRGLPVVVEGILRSREEYEIRGRPELGRMTQLELSVPGSRAIMTVVCTERAGGVSAGMAVRATGYFLKLRQFRTTDGQVGAGVVLVTNGMVRATRPEMSGATESQGAWSRVRDEWVFAGITALLVVWLLIRRRMRGIPASRSTSAMRSASPGPAATGDSDFAWMTSRDRREVNAPSHEARPKGESDC